MYVMKTLKYFLVGILFIAITVGYANSQTVNPKDKSSITDVTDGNQGSSNGCLHWHTVWECYEWYSNGIDCRRSRKIRVCDDFDVAVSGHMAKASSIQDTALTVNSAPVQISGRLGYILIISKDSTHWNLQLDKPLIILGQEINDIEVVFSKPEKFNIDKKDVKITGTIEWVQAQTKGMYPIVKVMEISAK